MKVGAPMEVSTLSDTVGDVSDALACGQPSFPCSRKALVVKFKESAKPISGFKFGTRYSKWYSSLFHRKIPLNFHMDIDLFQLTPASRGIGRALRSTTSDKLLTVQHKKFSPQIYSPTQPLIA